MRVADWFIPADNASGAVYGVILIGALLAAESERHETYLEAESSALIAAAVFWLAHAYATVLGWRLGARQPLSLGSVLRALAQDWTLMTGASIPLLVLFAAWLFGAPQSSGITAALWSVVISLVLLELIAGLRSRVAGWELAVDIAVGAGLGLGILALKIVLH